MSQCRGLLISITRRRKPPPSPPQGQTIYRAKDRQEASLSLLVQAGIESVTIMAQNLYRFASFPFVEQDGPCC